MHIGRNVLLSAIVAIEQDDKIEALKLLAGVLKGELYDVEIDEYKPVLRPSSSEQQIEVQRDLLRRFREHYLKKP